MNSWFSSLRPAAGFETRDPSDLPEPDPSDSGSSTTPGAPEPSGQALSRRRSSRPILADLVQRYYSPRTPRRRGSPKLRLQDWRIIAEFSAGPTEYVLLRRVVAPKAGLGSLTRRERDALRHVRTGASNKEIAHEMGISASTVGVLLSRVSRKLGATNREELIRVSERSP